MVVSPSASERLGLTVVSVLWLPDDVNCLEFYHLTHDLPVFPALVQK